MSATDSPQMARSLAAIERAEPSRTGHHRRVSSLDGLRGVAAFIVMIFHVVMATTPSLANDYLGPIPHYPAWSLHWLVSRTPLHILWAGPEMVLVFFVLSGYVLAMPAVRLGARWFDSSYAPRRFVRLFIPAWFALLIGGLLHTLHGTPLPGLSWWLNDHALPLTISNGLHNATLLDQSDNLWAYTSALWSLSDEVLFSILLPVLLGLCLYARRSRLYALAGAAVCLAGAYAGTRPTLMAHVHPAFLANDLRYLPVFVLGSLLALVRDVPRPRQWLFPVAAVLAICLLCASYMINGLASSGALGFPYLLDVTGALMIVWIAIAFNPARALLSIRPIHWLGSRSFSLYLVHEPIVVAVAWWLRHSFLPVLLVSVPLSLIAAELFWRLVENPAIWSARRAGDGARWASAQVWRLLGQRQPGVVG